MFLKSFNQPSETQVIDKKLDNTKIWKGILLIMYFAAGLVSATVPGIVVAKDNYKSDTTVTVNPNWSVIMNSNYVNWKPTMTQHIKTINWKPAVEDLCDWSDFILKTAGSISFVNWKMIMSWVKERRIENWCKR